MAVGILQHLMHCKCCCKIICLMHCCGLYHYHRFSSTLWGWDKMTNISRMTFSNAFCWMKMYEFWLRFHCSLFIRVQLTIFQNWFRYWLGTDQATSHYLNQWWLVYWCIYASLGLNELKGYPAMLTASSVWSYQGICKAARETKSPN